MTKHNIMSFENAYIQYQSFMEQVFPSTHFSKDSEFNIICNTLYSSSYKTAFPGRKRENDEMDGLGRNR